MRRARRQDGQALVEAALTIPILLLIAVAIFEFGRAYQTWQILTNAAREGARVAVVPGGGATGAQQRVLQYMQAGQLPNAGTAAISVNRNATIMVSGAAVSASQVDIAYPFNFIVLRPVARLINGSSALGSAVVINASATMRNEM